MKSSVFILSTPEVYWQYVNRSLEKEKNWNH